MNFPLHSFVVIPLCVWPSCSASGMESQRIAEMENMLKEAQLERARLIESRVSAKLSTTYE